MDAPLKFLLENLKQLVVYNVKLIAGANDELEKLKDELQQMQAILGEASKMPNKNDLFKIWVKKIRMVVYNVEDTIDTYITETALQKNKKVKSIFQPSRLAEQVKSLREKQVIPLLENAIEEFTNLVAAQTFQIGGGERKDKRNKAPREDNVVGLEDETETLVGYLNEKSDNLDVVSIIGMPGLGKTTVAWKIYRDMNIGYEFPTLIWLFISQEFNKRDMLLKILKKFTEEDMSNSSDADLAEKVKECLKRGKFLIFMDDVWTVEVWNEIKQVLPMANKMGKVLITSRHENVARHANPLREPHKLRFLTEVESWELLQLEVYGKLDSVHEGLEPIGRNIALQCDGLPLSIIVIGGILVDKLSTLGGSLKLKDEWVKVSDSVKKYLIQGDEEKLLENIISLSYTELPYELKDCFLYLGMFPDIEIPAWKLTQLWITEGFIQQKSDWSLEEVAKEKLKDLIDRNLVMVHMTKPDGEVKTCRVHDTIREFCKNEVVVNNQDLFEEITREKPSVFNPSVDILQKCRRICIHSFVHEFFKGKPKVPKARSFLCFSKSPINLEKDDIPVIINAFSLLKVFEASTIKFPLFPPKITQLLHLRYLTLSGMECKLLPKTLTDLLNLQTLIVDTSSRTLRIDADIWQLMQLRHLKTKASIILANDGKGNGGENLQTLAKLSPESCTEKVFTRAKNLNTLGIRGDLSMILDSVSFKKLELLYKLKLVHDAYPKVPDENPLPELPQPHKFPLKLRILVLSGTYLDWQHMSIVGQLGALEVLKLKDNAFMGNFWDVSVGGFLHLEFLYIERTDLTCWTTTGDGFPRLRSIVLKNCKKLQGVPIEQIKKLEMLYMERVSSYAVTSARKIEEEKLQAEGQQTTKRRGFKLVIAPGD